MDLTEEERGPGYRIRRPGEAEVRRSETETRSHRVDTLEILGPWKQAPSGDASRYRVTIHAYGSLDGSPVGDLLAEGPVPRDRRRHRREEGSFAGRPATLRVPKDGTIRSRAAYLAAGGRFYAVEWEGPAEEILGSLTFDEEAS